MNYHQQIQGWIYKILENKKMQEFLHEQGFSYGKRHFRLFCYSRLLGRSSYDRKNGQITFEPPVQLYLSSPWTEFLQNIMYGIMNQLDIRLGTNNLQIGEVSIEPTPDFTERNEYQIRMLSPVTIYSTLFTHDGRKKTYYYSPIESEFNCLIRENLIKKAKAFYSQDWSRLPFNITPFGNSQSYQQKIINYKGTIIKGWIGNFKISGDPLMMKLSYEAGLGGKNGQGFGMFSLIPDRIALNQTKGGDR